MTPINADDWFDILGLIIVGLVIIAAAAIPAWFAARSQRALRDQVQSVENQINNKPTNLRDDLNDALVILRGVRDRQTEQGRDIKGIREDIGEIRGELRDERGARIELQRQVDQLHRERDS